MGHDGNEGIENWHGLNEGHILAVIKLMFLPKQTTAASQC